MSSKRKTGPAHTARKRRRQRRNDDLYRFARRLGLPVSAGDVQGMSRGEIELAARAHRRFRRRTFSESLSILIQDSTLARAFSDALMPKLLFRKEVAPLPWPSDTQ